jgi:hypothetical protein
LLNFRIGLDYATRLLFNPEHGLKSDDPETWKTVLEKDANAGFPTIHLRDFYNEPIFKACETARLAGAIEDLIGVGM